MSAIDPTTPLGTERFDLGANRIREFRTWLFDAWQAFKARHQVGTTPNDPGTSNGFFKVPSTPPAIPAVGDFYFDNTNGLWYAIYSGPVTKLVGDLAAGTRFVFRQATAPPGWTRDTSLPNASFLRYTTAASLGSRGTADPATGLAHSVACDVTRGDFSGVFACGVSTHSAYKFVDILVASRNP